MKQWQKIGLGVLTVGITATTLYYFVIPFVKKKINEKKLKQKGFDEKPNLEEVKEEPPTKK